MLDIYAIEELRNKGVPATDDLPKYRYTAENNGHYGEPPLTCHLASPRHSCAVSRMPSAVLSCRHQWQAHVCVRIGLWAFGSLSVLTAGVCWIQFDHSMYCISVYLGVSRPECVYVLCVVGVVSL